MTGKSPVFDSVVTEPGDTAIILFTSARRARPRASSVTQTYPMMNVVTMNRLFGNKPASDTHVLTLPLFHTFGATVLRGQNVTLERMRTFDLSGARFLEALFRAAVGLHLWHDLSYVVCCSST